MTAKRDPYRLDMSVIDPMGRTRLFRARLPELATEYRTIACRWDAGQANPVLVLDGEARADISMRDRFAIPRGGRDAGSD